MQENSVMYISDSTCKITKLHVSYAVRLLQLLREFSQCGLSVEIGGNVNVEQSILTCCRKTNLVHLLGFLLLVEMFLLSSRLT